MNPNQKMSWAVDSQHATYESAAAKSNELKEAGLVTKIHMMGPYNKKHFAVKVGKAVEEKQ